MNSEDNVRPNTPAHVLRDFGKAGSPEQVLLDQDASDDQLEAAIDSVEESLEANDREIELLESKKSKTPLRVMRQRFDAKIGGLERKKTTLRAQKRQLLDRISRVTADILVEAARADGLDKGWLDKHDKSLTNKSASLPKKIMPDETFNKLKDSPRKERAKNQRDLLDKIQARLEKDEDATAVALELIQDLDPVFHARITGLPATQEKFVGLFLDAVPKLQ